MKLSETISIVTTLTALLSPVHGVVVRAFTSVNCQGYYQDINIYDNTCWTGPNRVFGLPFESFYITTYGAGGQYIRAYEDASCSSPIWKCEGAAAPGAAPLKTCYTMNKCQAFGSYAVEC